MSAKSEAIKRLGKEDDYINLAGFNTERTNAQNRYNTDYTNLQNKYNELVAQADRNKRAAKSDFNTNRLEIDRNAYMNNRGVTGADLSSRGLSEGFNAGGDFSAMLQRNNASSDIANTYYNSMADIQRQMDRDTQEHNYNLNNLKLNLEGMLADINAREAAQRNAYRTAVAQLAEQIQSRWDANYYAQRQLDEEIASNQALLAQGYVKNENLKTDSRYIIDEANTVVAQGKARLKDGTKVTNTGQALQWLQEYGRYRLSDIQAATEKSWEDLQKKKQRQSLFKLSNLFNIV